MLFNSVEFLIFLPMVFFLYWATPKKYRWITLLIASYVFYMFWNWKLIFLIVFTTLVSYATSLIISKYSKRRGIKITAIVVGLCLCIGVLVFFKYLPFFAQVYFDIFSVFTGKTIHGYFDVILPIGISFYTFQTASYIIDVFRGTIKAEKHLGYYALFVTFFAQLVAGPIERPSNLLPQLKEEKSIKNVDYSSAFRLMVVGFFKKIAIADIIGIFVNNVFENVNGATGLSSAVAALLFSVQIFCDFSGYSDIAVGCAKLFGVNLTENFKSPYRSKSIKEFWGRWHISLSSWLRDYVYIPLGGSRVNKARWALNIVIVFVISGLWHGANYTFIIWGLLHALFQIIGVFTLNARNKFWTKIKIDPEGKLVSITRIIITFLLVSFSFIFFRANSVNDAFIIIKNIFSGWSVAHGFFSKSLASLGMGNVFAWIYTLVCIASLVFLERIKVGDFGHNSVNHSVIRYASYFLLTAFVVGSWFYLQSSDISSSFIYFQF